MKEKLEVTYKSIQQLKEQLKIKERENYKGLLSVAIRLTNFWFSKCYTNEEEYEFFTHCKAIRICIELLPWLAVANDRWQFGKKSFPFKKYLKEVNTELDEIKFGIIQLWKNGELKSRLERNKKKLVEITNKFDKYRLELYIKMIENLIKRYPKCEPQLFSEITEDLNYVGKI